jgi:arylsulfatase A-like enzyme
VILTSDHGESLGEHDYYFDHGEDLFDPCLAIPLIVAVPGSGAGSRSEVLASTLDVFPTILDAAKVSYPSDLAGTSLLPAVKGAGTAGRERLYAQNERGLSATFGARLKLVATPGPSGTWYALYDRGADPGEAKDVAATRPEEQRQERRELDLYLARADREWSRTRTLLSGAPAGEGKMTPEACEKLKALGYVQECAP